MRAAGRWALEERKSFITSKEKRAFEVSRLDLWDLLSWVLLITSSLYKCRSEGWTRQTIWRKSGEVCRRT